MRTVWPPFFKWFKSIALLECEPLQNNLNEWNRLFMQHQFHCETQKDPLRKVLKLIHAIEEYYGLIVIYNHFKSYN